MLAKSSEGGFKFSHAGGQPGLPGPSEALRVGVAASPVGLSLLPPILSCIRPGFCLLFHSFEHFVKETDT